MNSWSAIFVEILFSLLWIFLCSSSSYFLLLYFSCVALCALKHHTLYAYLLLFSFFFLSFFLLKIQSLIGLKECMCETHTQSVYHFSALCVLTLMALWHFLLFGFLLCVCCVSISCVCLFFSSVSHFHSISFSHFTLA